MAKRRTIIVSAVVLVLMGAAAWAFGFFNRTDPAVAELQQLGSQMWDKNLPDAQRNQLRDDFRQRMGSLTDDQRRAFFDANRDQWNGRMQDQMDEYFKMSKADQQKRLDEILDRIVKSRNSQQQRQQNAMGGNQPGPNGQRANNVRGGNNNRGDRRNMTDAQREERSKKRLDRTTPKMRAEYTEFRKQLDARAQQRGINVGDQRGGGFPGGGFGGFGRGPRGA